jgi:hypothetical protein
MKTNDFISTITVTTKGKTGHGVEFTLVGVRKYADIPAEVRALLAEGEALEGYKWHAPQTKSEVGYLWQGFATAKDAKAEAKRLKAFMHEPAKTRKGAKAKPETPPKADKPKPAKTRKGAKVKPETPPKADKLAELKALLAGLSDAERAEVVLALFA